MGLTAPGVGTEIGPNWAQEINGDLSILDSHNHSSGQGVQISPPGMNINTDLPFNSNNATLLRTIRFISQASIITPAVPDIGCVYVVGDNLWYNSYTSGNHVQITNGSSVNATSSGIANGNASAAFSGPGGILQVYSNSSTPIPGAIASGPIEISPTSSATYATTIQAYSSLAASYTLTLPTAIAGVAGSIMQSDGSGNLSYTVADGTTITNSGGVLAAGVMQTANYAANSVTRPKLAAVGQQISASCGNFSTSSTSLVNVTNLTNTITTSGRPVMIFLQGIAVAIPNSQMSVLWGSASSEVTIAILSSSNSGSSYTNICQWRFNQTVPSGNTQELNNSYLFMDAPAATSGLIYKVQVLVGNSSDLLSFQSITLVTYEL